MAKRENSQENLCCIFGGADIGSERPAHIPYLICADGGYLHAKRMGRLPEVVLGDFDTLPEPPDPACEIITYPAEKDDTDTMLAVKLALERGFSDLRLYGCLGGRFDHTMANLQTLAYVKMHGANAILYGERCEIHLLRNEKAVFPRKDGYYFSIFAFDGPCSGITLEGMKYPLQNADLTCSFPLGVSNEIISEYGAAEVKNGSLLVIFAK